MRYDNIERRYNEMLGVTVLVFAEVESLRGRMKDKEREIEEIRRNSLAPFRS